MSTVTETKNVTYQEEIVTRPGARKVLAIFRIVLGFTFFWAFIDKLFGLGFATEADRAWINGGKPAQGFLMGMTGEGTESNPFRGLMEFFLSWGSFADILFMVGLLGIGVALITGAGLKIAAVTGTLLMLFMYFAQFPLTQGGTNPITDSHWIEALAMITFASTLAGDTWGLGKWWGGIVGDSWLR